MCYCIAIACLNEDTTNKNNAFCSKYKQILKSTGNNLLELPFDVKGFVEMVGRDTPEPIRSGRPCKTLRKQRLCGRGTENPLPLGVGSVKLISKKGKQMPCEF